MSRPVPAATATLRVLRFLSTQPVPVAASRIAAEIGLARSTTYHLLDAMAEQDFVVHYPDERTWGLGVGAWEVGVAFAAQEPLARLARLPLARLVDRVGRSAHLVMLQGADVLYVIEERARGRPPLVTDVGVRLPAHLTASGRAILATLPRAQVRALYPSAAAFVSRTGRGPAAPSELREVLTATRTRGYAEEDGEVTDGFASAAVALTEPALRASVAVTWETRDDVDVEGVLEAIRATTAEIDRRLRHR
ncbi:DNA-binding IclR family transcriptional regulator [Mumia flava]|uniref:DNA-binding IclR family transcriptional regulator n=1 Tax=Mumia flava TaxID=1348852 RepID=A0A0B2BJS2_9ACTN|nr:IclR family transcriptional regulator [Mumia flava]PJJ56526.1 DNA-binding IclR family transcriptional regulator [Mumia flava]